MCQQVGRTRVPNAVVGFPMAACTTDRHTSLGAQCPHAHASASAYAHTSRLPSSKNVSVGFMPGGSGGGSPPAAMPTSARTRSVSSVHALSMASMRHFMPCSSTSASSAVMP